MDPNATLTMIISTFRDSDWEACMDSCDALTQWLVRGGFAPGRFSPEHVRGFCAITRHACKAQLATA
jgi:hypothetical protein